MDKYVYGGLVTKVIDGDTLDIDVDLGFNMRSKMRVRLNRINTPELKGPEKLSGLTSKEYVEAKLLNKPVLVKTIKDKQEKYGRYLAEIYYEIEALNPDTYTCINDELVKLNLAQYKDY